MVDTTLAALRAQWDGRAAGYTDGPNKRLTLQAATQLHAHMQLSSALRVLEVAAGPGLGALDIAARMLQSNDPEQKKKSLTVSDFSPAMVELARANIDKGLRDLKAVDRLDVSCVEANGQDLTLIPTGSIDRYISSLGLQLVPDPDAMIREARRVLAPNGVAGFVIWGRPEFSSTFTIFSAVNAELELEGGEEHPYFALGKDVSGLRSKLKAAGFSELRLWPYIAPVECWSGEGLAKYMDITRPVEDEKVRAKRFQVAEHMANQWMDAKEMPIGLEVYLVLAKVSTATQLSHQ